MKFFKDEKETIIHDYNNDEIIGNWGIYNIETKTSKICGKMIGKTVKVLKQNGQISLKRIWFPDNDYSKGKE